MADEYTSFTGSVPEKYDKYLGPFLFEHFAAVLADKLIQYKPSKILDIACGTGIVTKKIAEILPEARVIGLDLNPDMIEYGKKTIGGKFPIEWKVSDAENLPFDNETLDAVTCQFGIMFFPDKVRVINEVMRVLKPNGIFIFNTWDSLQKNDIMKIADEVMGRIFSDNPPDFYKIPFSFYDTKEIHELLSQLCFKDINIEYVTCKAEYESAESLMVGIVEGTPVIGQINERDPLMVPVIRSEMEIEVKTKFGDSPVRANLSAIMCTCRK